MMQSQNGTGFERKLTTEKRMFSASNAHCAMIRQMADNPGRSLIGMSVQKMNGAAALSVPHSASSRYQREGSAAAGVADAEAGWPPEGWLDMNQTLPPVLA